MVAARHGTALQSTAEDAVEVSAFSVNTLTMGRDSSRPGVTMPFEAGRFGLDWFTRGARRRHSTLVVGDSAGDHALGMLLDRLHGPGSAHWTPLMDGDQPTEGVRRWLQRCDRDGVAEVHLTSLTVPRSELDALVEVLESHDGGLRINDEPVPLLRHTTLRADDPMSISVDGPRAQLADGHRLHLPGPMSFDSGRSLPPTPTPPMPRAAEEHPAGTVQWVVDAMVSDLAMPPRSTLTEPTSGFGSAVRPSAEGWSWSALSHLLVAVDVAPIHHMSVPAALRQPSVHQALERLAGAADIRIQPSNLDVAYNATIDAWGGLRQLADTFRDPVEAPTLQELAGRGEIHPVFKGLQQPPMRLRDIRAITDFAMSLSEASSMIDVWASRGIVHRGYCLKCPDCRHGDHYRLEVVGTTWECSRCRRRHDLGRGWPLPHPSPPLYYVLDELVRIALDDNIEVPVLALDSAMDRTRRGFDWVVGLEAVNALGDVITDIDYAYLDGSRLVMGEAKSNGRIGVDELAELRTLAEALTADTLELSTTLDKWRSAHVTELPPSWRPEVRLLQAAELGLPRETAGDEAPA